MATETKNKGIILIIGAVIFALIAAILAYVIISQVTVKYPVYEAQVEITKGDPLTKDKLIVQYQPKSAITGALKPGEELDKKLDKMIAEKDLSPGDILKTTNTIDLSNTNLEGSLAVLSARLRAISEEVKRTENVELVGGEIPIDSVKGMLAGMKAGDRVYVIGVSKQKSDENSANISETEKVVNEVITTKEVVNEAIVIGIKQDEGNGALIVALKKEDAPKLAEAMEIGKVYAYLLPVGMKSNN